MRPQSTFAKALLSPLLLTSSVFAELAIYEPFDYTDTGAPDGVDFLGNGSQAGGLGLGEWRHANSRADNTNEIEVRVPGLEFTDGGANQLPSLGGQAFRASRVGQASASSDVSSAATAALTADNTTMWMSFLFIDTGFSGPDSAIVLASEELVASDSQNLVAPGFGVGVDIVLTPASAPPSTTEVQLRPRSGKPFQLSRPPAARRTRSFSLPRK